MQSSLSSRSDSSKTIDILISIFTWIFRTGVGATFIFSGFVKAVDPWGTLYKFEEYTAAIGIPVLHNLLLFGVFVLCALEFIIGVSVLLGCYRKSSPVVALIFMCVMLPLTLWVAISDPVKDCGCFGDYLVISNWATFWKNVILTLMIVWLLKFNRDETTVISPAFQWMQIVFSLVFIGAVSFYGYFVQPLLDFRPYPSGSALISESDQEEDDDAGYIFVYSKDGVKKEFSIDDELPSEEDGWEFVERKEIKPAKESVSDDKTLRIWDRNGNTDYTDMVFDNSGNMLVLLIPDLQSVSPATTWKINALYDWSEKSDIDMIAIVSGSTAQIQEWEDLSMPQYDIYTADDTAIKEVARGNPSVIYLDKGIIEWKSTLSALDVDSLTELGDKADPAVLKTDSGQTLLNWFYIYLASLAVLISISMLPRIRNAFSTAAVIDDDKARREE